MKIDFVSILVLAGSLFSAVPSVAQELMDEYTTVIGSADRANSRGTPLTKPEQILAQDRANYHRFGVRDAGDGADQFFGVRENRAAIPQLLGRGAIAPEVANAILYETNPRLRVQVFGKSGRPEFISVTLQDPPQKNLAESPGANDAGAAGTVIGAIPSFGASTRSWKFVTDPHEWRGTALFGEADDIAVGLACTRPGAQPDDYPGGGHVRPHEPGVYNLFIDPSSLDGDYGSPGAQTFTVAVSIDGQAFGNAPVVLLSPEMKLATNIPSDSLLIQGLRSGSTLTVVDPVSDNSADVPLSGSAAALDTLAAFCARPLQQSDGSEPAASAEQRGIPREAGLPAFAAHLSCPVYMRPYRDGELYVLNCKNVDGSPLGTPTATRIGAQVALHTLGCNVPVIDGAPTAENARCFLEMFGLDRQDLTDRDIRYLSKVSAHAEKTNLVKKLVELGYVLNSEPSIGASAETPKSVGDGDDAETVAQTSADPESAGSSLAHGLKCERTRNAAVFFLVNCTNEDGSAVNRETLMVAAAQFALREIGCEVPEITGNLSDSQDAIACFDEMFDPDFRQDTDKALRTLAEAATVTSAQEALELLQYRGFTLSTERSELGLAESSTASLVDGAAERRPDDATTEQAQIVKSASDADHPDFEVNNASAVAVSLTFPKNNEGDIRTIYGYFNSDLGAPLVRQALVNLNDEKGYAQRGEYQNAYAAWLSTRRAPLHGLFKSEPSRTPSEIVALWGEELTCAKDDFNARYCTLPNSKIFSEEIVAAVQQNPVVQVCEYDRLQAPGTSIEPLAVGLYLVSLHFWAQPMPRIVSAPVLREYPDMESEVHPLLAIGPYIGDCPQTMGEALGYIAGQFPDLVPAANATEPELRTTRVRASAPVEYLRPNPLFKALDSPMGTWMKNIALGRFELARGATDGDRDVIARQMQRLRLFTVFYHDVFDGMCEITGPSRGFAHRADLVTRDANTGMVTDRQEGTTETIEVRSEYVDVFLDGYSLASNPAAMIFTATGANFGSVFQDFATVSRDVILANGCGSEELDRFERNLAAIVRQEPSLQSRGKAMTLLEARCVETNLAGMAKRTTVPVQEACGCLSKALWNELPEERVAEVEDDFSPGGLLIAASLTPKSWERAQACVQ